MNTKTKAEAIALGIAYVQNSHGDTFTSYDKEVQARIGLGMTLTRALDEARANSEMDKLISDAPVKIVTRVIDAQDLVDMPALVTAGLGVGDTVRMTEQKAQEFDGNSLNGAPHTWLK
jgi:hypothetical protein